MDHAVLLVLFYVLACLSTVAQLFCFDRTRDLSSYCASQIAAAAQIHSQSDDITVLTLQFALVEVLHA